MGTLPKLVEHLNVQAEGRREALASLAGTRQAEAKQEPELVENHRSVETSGPSIHLNSRTTYPNLARNLVGRHMSADPIYAEAR